jgi:hypothetical protein
MPQNSDSLSEHIENTNQIRKELQIIADELARILDGDIISMTLATRIKFKCQTCGQVSVVHEDVLREKHRAICINPQCRAEYQAEENKGNWRFKMRQISFKCRNCETANWLEIRQLDVGTRFRCRKCAEAHQIIAGEFRYDLEKNVKEKSEQGKQPNRE